MMSATRTLPPPLVGRRQQQQPEYVTFPVFSTARTDYERQPNFVSRFVTNKSPDGFRVDR
jgi:hypothetical protein